MRRLDSHSASDHQKQMRESQTVPCDVLALVQKNTDESLAVRRAAFSTPSSPRYDPGHPTHLRDETSTHRYRKVCSWSQLNLPRSPKISHDLRPISIDLPMIFPDIDQNRRSFDSGACGCDRGGIQSARVRPEPIGRSRTAPRRARALCPGMPPQAARAV